MVDNQTGASGPADMGDQGEHPTVPPTSRVAPNEAGRKKDWVELLWRAAQTTGKAGGELSAVCLSGRQLGRQVGELALQGFSLLSDADRSEIIEAATERFFRGSAALVSRVDNPERLFLHAIRCEVVALIKRRIDASLRGVAPRAEDRLDARVLAWLSQAQQRMAKLRRLQQRVFRLTLTLDSISPVINDEKTQRVLPFLIGVALGLRVNSVHQHQARMRKKLLSGDPGCPDVELMDALRYLWAPPADLAREALVYLATYQTHTGAGASHRLYNAQKEYAGHLKAFKEASERARCAWRALVVELDASAPKPRDVHEWLFWSCEELGIDDRVSRQPKKRDRAGETKGQGQTWGDILLEDDAKRPVGAEREAWKRFLTAHLWSLEVEARFGEFEARSSEADVARSAVAGAYRALLAAANEPKDLMRTITELLDLVGAEQSAPSRG